MAAEVANGNAYRSIGLTEREVRIAVAQPNSGLAVDGFCCATVIVGVLRRRVCLRSYRRHDRGLVTSKTARVRSRGYPSFATGYRIS